MKGRRGSRSSQPDRAVAAPVRSDAIASAGAAMIGVLVNGYATYVHHYLRHAIGWRSPTTIGIPVACDGFLLGSVSSPFFIPLPFLAALLFLMLAIEGGRGARAASEQTAARHLLRVLAGGIVMIALTVLVGAIALIMMSEICVTGLLSILTATATTMLARRGLLSMSRFGSRGLTLRASTDLGPRNPLRLGALLSFPLLGMLLFERYGPGQSSPLCKQLASAAIAGSPTHPTEIMIFSDFQCGWCKRAARGENKLRRVRSLHIGHRQYAWDSECNWRVDIDNHEGECRQARAAICAAQLGRGDEFREQLFAQELTSEEELVRLGTSLDLSAEALRKCMTRPETDRILAADIAAANAHGRIGTPMFVIGRERFIGFGEADERCIY